MVLTLLVLHSQELQYLHLAINNITMIENLHRCESLAKLDLTMNFVDRPALSSLACLQPLIFLRELHLLGNPCTKWQSYRAYVIAMLPQLRTLVRFNTETPCRTPSVHCRVAGNVFLGRHHVRGTL